MIYKHIDIEEDFHIFLLNNIQEASDFVKSNPERDCFLTIGINEDKTDISTFLNYVPNYDISQELKDSLIAERQARAEQYPSHYTNYDVNDWELGCYGSHSIDMTLEEFNILKNMWIALNREDRINDILY